MNYTTHLPSIFVCIRLPHGSPTPSLLLSHVFPSCELSNWDKFVQDVVNDATRIWHVYDWNFVGKYYVFF